MRVPVGMNRLAIETATNTCSIALETAHGVYVRSEADQRIHSKVLLPWVGELLCDAGLGYDSLNAVVVGTGPGGFTSLRVGLSVAQGVALAHALPIYPVPTMLNIASGCPAGTSVLVVMDARLGQVYAQGFEFDERTQQWAALNDPSVCSPEALTWPDPRDGWVVMGSGLKIHEGALPDQLRREAVALWPEAEPCAERALALADSSVAPWALHAHYVRNQVTG